MCINYVGNDSKGSVVSVESYRCTYSQQRDFNGAVDDLSELALE